VEGITSGKDLDIKKLMTQADEKLYKNKQCKYCFDEFSTPLLSMQVTSHPH
jgi:hypothetical protein